MLRAADGRLGRLCVWPVLEKHLVRFRIRDDVGQLVVRGLVSGLAPAVPRLCADVAHMREARKAAVSPHITSVQ
jgi:hypothetical protein